METLIGYGSPNKANTHGVHGAPLGSDETALTREQLKWKYGEFEIPDEVYDLFGHCKTKGAAAEKQWEKNLAEYSEKYPEVRGSGADLPLCPASALFGPCKTKGATAEKQCKDLAEFSEKYPKVQACPPLDCPKL